VAIAGRISPRYVLSNTFTLPQVRETAAKQDVVERDYPATHNIQIPALQHCRFLYVVVYTSAPGSVLLQGLLKPHYKSSSHHARPEERTAITLNLLDLQMTISLRTAHRLLAAFPWNNTASLCADDGHGWTKRMAYLEGHLQEFRGAPQNSLARYNQQAMRPRGRGKVSSLTESAKGRKSEIPSIVNPESRQRTNLVPRRGRGKAIWKYEYDFPTRWPMPRGTHDSRRKQGKVYALGAMGPCLS